MNNDPATTISAGSPLSFQLVFIVRSAVSGLYCIQIVLADNVSTILQWLLSGQVTTVTTRKCQCSYICLARRLWLLGGWNLPVIATWTPSKPDKTGDFRMSRSRFRKWIFLALILHSISSYICIRHRGAQKGVIWRSERHQNKFWGGFLKL